MKTLDIIINPKSGVSEAIKPLLKEILGSAGISYELHVTKDETSVQKFARIIIKRGSEAVVVYGGDGTVAEVARCFYKKDIPLIILPGGSANAFRPIF